MVWNVLFLQHALYTVHCTIIMQPSFVITRRFYLIMKIVIFFNIHGNKMHHILRTQFQNDFDPIYAVKWFVLLLWRHGVDWACGVNADVDNGWDECIVPIGRETYAWNIRFDTRLILSSFLNHFIFHFIQGIKNGCPCIMDITGT